MQRAFGAASGISNRVLAPLHSPQLALMLAALFWSGNFIAGRMLRGQVDPVTLNLLRWLGALLIFLPFVWRGLRAHHRALWREWRLILALGATGIAAFQTLNYVALQTTSATHALLVLALAPIAILIGGTISGMDHPNRRQMIGMGISVIGAGVVITRGDLAILYIGGLNRGDLIMLFNVLIWTVYSLLLRRRPTDLPQDVTLAGSMLAGVLLLLPFADSTALAALSAPGILLGIGYMALFASVLAFLFWSFGVSRLGPTRSGQFINLMPVFGAGLALLLLGEIPGRAEIVGAGMVLAGIATVESGRMRN
ncbi:MAG TPA: DMT family transporter [Pseudolabrys sp.]|nr:DMT family transporter [Pseudolabrys sp.]